MNHLLRIGAFLAIAALFTLSAIAQDAAPAPTPAAAPACDQAKTDIYPKWLDNRGGDPAKQKMAYDVGKEFLSKCTDDTDAYVKAVKKWVAKYEEAVVNFERRKKFEEAAKALEAAQGTKDYAPLFAAGKDVIAVESENLSILLALTNAGVLNATAGKASNKALDADAIAFGKRALALVEAGKGTPEELKLVNAANKDEALAALNYRLGILSRTSSPEEAANYLLKVAQSNSPLKSDSSLYFYLAQAYTNGDYKKIADDYNARFAGKEETDESRLAQAKLNQSVDRIIDAYARAIALNTKTDAASVSFKNELTATLTTLYKQRHDGSDAGLTEFIAGSATRRLPLPTDPVPTPPPAAGAPTPTGTPTPTPSPTPTPTRPPTPTPTPSPTPTPTPTPTQPPTARPDGRLQD